MLEISKPNHESMKQLKLNHPYLHNLELLSCLSCIGSNDPCFTASGDGYSSCQKCHDSSGPSQRDCLIAIVQDYANMGELPFYEISGPITLVGQVVDFMSEQPLVGIGLKLVFPNGLVVSQVSGENGDFAIALESHRKELSPQQLDLGQMRFNSVTQDVFIHLTIQGVVPFRSEENLDTSPR